MAEALRPAREASSPIFMSDSLIQHDTRESGVVSAFRSVEILRFAQDDSGSVVAECPHRLVASGSPAQTTVARLGRSMLRPYKETSGNPANKALDLKLTLTSSI